MSRHRRKATSSFKRRLARFLLVLPIVAFALLGVDPLSDGLFGANSGGQVLSNPGAGFLSVTQEFASIALPGGLWTPSALIDTLPYVESPTNTIGGLMLWELSPTEILSSLQNLGAVMFSDATPKGGNQFDSTSPSTTGGTNTSLSFPFGFGGPSTGGGPSSPGTTIGTAECQMPECQWNEWQDPGFGLTPPSSSDEMSWTEDTMGWPLGTLTNASGPLAEESELAGVPEPASWIALGSGVVALIGLSRITIRRAVTRSRAAARASQAAS